MLHGIKFVRLTFFPIPKPEELGVLEGIIYQLLIICGAIPAGELILTYFITRGMRLNINGI